LVAQCVSNFSATMSMEPMKIDLSTMSVAPRTSPLGQLSAASTLQQAPSFALRASQRATFALEPVVTPASDVMLGDVGMDVEDVRPPPGLPPPRGLPSHGSVLHGTSRCKPCTWFWKAGCGNGKDCGHCHLCPRSEIAERRRRRRQQKVNPISASSSDTEAATSLGSADLESLSSFSSPVMPEFPAVPPGVFANVPAMPPGIFLKSPTSDSSMFDCAPGVRPH